MFKEYYQLAKPGIIYGNLMTAAAGFLLASKDHVHFILFIATLLGMALLIASACAFNNYFDRDIDAKMKRTKKRAMVSGTITGRSALMYATLLGVFGIFVLARYVNGLVLGIGVSAFFAYVVLYGMWSKRRSVQGTVVGSLSGAAPILAGYCAVSDRIDAGAIIVFLILVCWQMPHFYAIAMYRIDDYRAAKIPVYPIAKGMRATKLIIISYIAAFTLSSALLTSYGYTGYTYLLVMILLGGAWFGLGIKGLKVIDDQRWARKMFFFSLIAITVMSVMVAVGPLLP